MTTRAWAFCALVLMGCGDNRDRQRTDRQVRELEQELADKERALRELKLEHEAELKRVRTEAAVKCLEEQVQRTAPPPRTTAKPACNCKPTDPLCDCL